MDGRTNAHTDAHTDLRATTLFPPLSGTHKTPSEIALHIGDISESSVRRIIRDDLQLRPLKKIKGQRLSVDDCVNRVEKCGKLLRIYTRSVLEKAFFSDEKIFKVQQLYNAQNDRVYAPVDDPKSSVASERLICERSGFPEYVMVSVSVSKRGKTNIHFVDLDAKVNGEYYRNKMLRKMIPQMNSITDGEDYLFMQDGARAHTARATIELLESECQLQCLYPEWWPANSPDLNPVDYCVWAELERRVFKGRRITTIDELKLALKAEWKLFPQTIINNSIDAFHGRIRRVVELNGGQIEK